MRKYNAHAVRRLIIAAGILIRLGFDVGIVDVSGTPYDLLIIAFKIPNDEKTARRLKPAKTHVHNLQTLERRIFRENMVLKETERLLEA